MKSVLQKLGDIDASKVKVEYVRKLTEESNRADKKLSEELSRVIREDIRKIIRDEFDALKKKG